MRMSPAKQHPLRLHLKGTLKPRRTLASVENQVSLNLLLHCTRASSSPHLQAEQRHPPSPCLCAAASSQSSPICKHPLSSRYPKPRTLLQTCKMQVNDPFPQPSGCTLSGTDQCGFCPHCCKRNSRRSSSIVPILVQYKNNLLLITLST